MSLSKFITEVWWEPSQGFDVRGSTVLSDSTKIRLDPEDFQLKLKLQSNWRYPTDADLYVQSRTYRPEAIHRILMIQVNATIPVDEDGNDLGSIGIRIFDGTDQMWWNGGAWVVAGAGEWNTEDEINQNVSTLDVSNRAFALVFNLVTTDDTVTPVIESALVLWEGEIDWSQDVILDSLTQTVQEEAVYVDDVSLPPIPAASSSIDLDDYVDESNLTVSDVDAVYDHSADPNHRTDLLSSYDSGTRVITLTAAIPAGNVPYLRLRVLAHVAWNTQQDFEEVGDLPQVVLRDTDAVSSSPYPFSHDSGIVRKDTGSAVVVPAPYRMTYQVTMEVRTDRSRGQQRVQDSLLRLLTSGPTGEIGPFLRSRATDRRYRLWLIEEFRAVTPELNLSDVRSHQAVFRIQDVALNLRPAVDAFAVKSFNMGFNATSSEAEQEAIRDGTPVPRTSTETFEVS